MKTFKKMKARFADWAVKNSKFPYKEMKSGTELMWMLKDCCPYCITEPIEYLSNAEYAEKYPVKFTLDVGHNKIYLCEYHLRELKKSFTELDIDEVVKNLDSEDSRKQTKQA